MLASWLDLAQAFVGQRQVQMMAGIGIGSTGRRFEQRQGLGGALAVNQDGALGVLQSRVGAGDLDCLADQFESFTAGGGLLGQQHGRGLAAQVAEPGGRILYGRGEETAFPLAETLGAAGCAVSEIVLYRARAVKALPALGHFDAALFFSRRGVEIFHDIVEKQGLNANFSQIKALCLGEGMVEFLTLQGWQDIAVASSPDRHGMLTLMDTIL